VKIIISRTKPLISHNTNIQIPTRRSEKGEAKYRSEETSIGEGKWDSKGSLFFWFTSSSFIFFFSFTFLNITPTILYISSSPFKITKKYILTPRHLKNIEILRRPNRKNRAESRRQSWSSGDARRRQKAE
jgi:hypothetical protein